MLLEKLKAALARAGEIRAMVEAEGRDYTEAEASELQQLAAQVENLEKSIKAEQSLDAAGAGLQGQGRKVSAGGASGARVKAPAAEDTRGFNDLADFANAVKGSVNGSFDQRLYAAAPEGGHSTNGGNGEGFLVPPAFSQRILESAFADDADLLGLVDSEPTGANQVSLLADDSTPWATAGVFARWRAEGAKFDASKLDVAARDVKLHQLYAFTVVTDELLADAPRLAARLANKAPEAIRWKLNEAIRFGTGVGQPLGFMKSKALVTVAKESGQAAGTVNAKNIANMFARMLPSAVAGAHWEINPELLPEIMMLTIGDRPIWTPPTTGFADAPGGFLLGRPIRFTEHAKAAGAVGDIMLVSAKGYYMPVHNSGMKFDQSMHLYFDHGSNAFRWTFRAGGQPHLAEAVAPQNGTATKSHFVTLAARA